MSVPAPVPPVPARRIRVAARTASGAPPTRTRRTGGAVQCPLCRAHTTAGGRLIYADETKCTVCFREYCAEIRPHALGCGHGLCAPCVDGLVQNLRDTRDTWHSPVVFMAPMPLPPADMVAPFAAALMDDEWDHFFGGDSIARFAPAAPILPIAAVAHVAPILPIAEVAHVAPILPIAAEITLAIFADGSPMPPSSFLNS